MKLVIAADHAGFPLKEEVRGYLERLGHEVVDLGAYNIEPSDYSDFAEAVGKALGAGRAERGILICGSGVGVNVAANKMPGVRASMCHDTYSAHQGVEHDDMNVLVMGARIIGTALAFDLVSSFLNARFQKQEERFVRRLNKVKAIEARNMPEAAKLESHCSQVNQPRSDEALQAHETAQERHGRHQHNSVGRGRGSADQWLGSRKGRAAVLSQFGLDRDSFEQRHEMSNDPWEKGLITVEEYLTADSLLRAAYLLTRGDFLAAMKARSANAVKTARLESSESCRI